MDTKKSEQYNIRTLANAFNIAISSASMGLSILIVYNNKELAIDLCGIIHNYRKGKIRFVNLHRFQNPDSLRAYLFGNSMELTNLLSTIDVGTIVFENADLITKEFQQILRAFYDHIEREQISMKLIFLSRSSLTTEREVGHYDSPLFYRISGTVIDCRLVQDEII